MPMEAQPGAVSNAHQAIPAMSVRGEPIGKAPAAPPVLEAPDHDRGLVGTIVNEIAADVIGGAKVVTAAALSPLAILGAEVPISWEDITSRDVQGAGMIAATVASGGLAHAARGTALGARAAASWGGRAGLTAGIEGAAGTLYGILRERQPGESRLEAIAEETAVFATLGAGASMLKSAYNATVGGMRAGMLHEKARTQLADAAQRVQSEISLQEHLGVVLLNPETGTRAAVRRNSDGNVILTRYDRNRVIDTREFRTRESKAVQTNPVRMVTHSIDPMNDALATATRDGFLEPIGPFRRQILASATDLPEASLKLFEEAGSADAALKEIGLLRLGEYRGVVDAAQALRESEGEIARLAAEIIAPGDAFGDIRLIESTKRAAAADLGLSPAQVAKMSDAEVLKQLVLQGLVGPESLQAGVNQRDMLRQLFINAAVPEGSDIVISRARDAMFTSISTPFKLAGRHPEVKPLVESADRRLHALEQELRADHATIHTLRVEIPLEKQNTAARIIDESAIAEDGTVRTLQESQVAARAAAAAMGDAQVEKFVDLSIQMLDRKGKRLAEMGMLPGGGRTGYFPIVNAGEWKVEVAKRDSSGKLTSEFRGFFKSQEEARVELLRLRSEDDLIALGTISPKNIVLDGDFLVKMSPAQYATARRSLIDAATEEVDFARATEIMGSFAKMSPGKKGAGNLRPRVLGMRDFSIPPIDALKLYTESVERALQFHTFEGEAVDIISKIPANKARLRDWSEQYVADMLGRPRPVETAFQAIMDSVSSITDGRLPVPPRALRQYGAALRKWEAFSRLGGFWSGAVNLTQIAINTFPVLGAKWTAHGLSALAGPKHFHEVARTLDNAGVDLELFIPFTEAGEMPAFNSVTGAIAEKSYLEAVNRAALFVFNGAERINRVVTAWGAYNKALAEGQGADLAAGYAREVVARTQFNYRLSNVPELLRSPIGSVIGQFKSYVVNEAEFIGSLSPREFARFGTAIWATGGLGVLANMPGVDLVDSASTLFMDQKLTEAMKLAPDGPVGKGLVYGMPGLIANVDLSDYLGIGTVRDITSGILGPGVSDAVALGTFLRDAAIDVGESNHVSNATLNSFLQRAMPSALRRAMRGYEIAQTGEIAHPYTGKLLYAPESRLRSAIQTGLGAPDIHHTQERIADDIVTRSRQRFIRIRTSYAKEAAQAIREGRIDEAAAIRAEAQAAGFAIDGRTMGYWVKELGRPSDARRE